MSNSLAVSGLRWRTCPRQRSSVESVKRWLTPTPAGRFRMTSSYEGLKRAPDLKILVDTSVSENGACW